MRRLILALALSSLSGDAWAQFTGTGGISPYSFNAPASVAGSIAAAPSGANTAHEGCAWVSQGRGGGSYQCDGRSIDPPKR